MNDVRWILASRTFWCGVAAIGKAVFDAIQSGLDYKAVTLAGFGALMIYLRTVTDKPTSLKKPIKNK
jgi:hypothetical protein